MSILPLHTTPKTGSVQTQRLQVSNYLFPAVDGCTNHILATDGFGHLYFTDPINVSGVVGGAGSGVDNRLVRWDGSENIQNSVVALSDGGDMSGIVILTATQVNAVNSNFSMAVSGTNAILSVDASDALQYNRTTNTHQLMIGGTATFSQTSALTSNITAVDLATGGGNTLAAATDGAISSLNTTVGGTNNTVFSTAGSTTSGTFNSLVACGSCRVSGGGQGVIIGSTSSSISGTVGQNVIAGAQFSNIGGTAAGAFTGGIATFIAGSIGANVTGNTSAAIAVNSCNVIGSTSMVSASRFSSCQSNLASCSITAGETSFIDGSAIACALIASSNSRITHLQSSAMIGCMDCSMGKAPAAAYQFGNVMLASDTTAADGLAVDYLVFGGVGGRTWAINSAGGSMHAATAVFDGTVPDYAEFFENEASGVIPIGSLVSMNNGKVRVAGPGDEPIGVISGNPAVVLGAAGFNWAGKYLKDEWNRPVKTMQPQRGWKPSEGQTEADHPQTLQLTLNPAYKKDEQYRNREERPEDWSKVGLVGQLLTRVAAGVASNDYIESTTGGVGVPSEQVTRIRVMRVTQPFDAKKRYAIALCLVR